MNYLNGADIKDGNSHLVYAQVKNDKIIIIVTNEATNFVKKVRALMTIQKIFKAYG